MNVSPVHHNVLFLKLLELYQLLQGRLYIEPFLICSDNFHCLVYHIKYHHSQELIKALCIVSTAFRGRLIESRLIRPITLLHFLIFWSTWALKLSFESKTIPKCFWWGHSNMSILLNLIGRCDKLFEFVFEEKVT